jgi:hypothetical protein
MLKVVLLVRFVITVDLSFVITEERFRKEIKIHAGTVKYLHAKWCYSLMNRLAIR